MIATAGSATRHRVAIAGGSGYGGAESLRWIALHPNLEACAVTSRRNAGKSVADVHPNLAGFHDELTFAADVEGLLDSEPDAVILAVPHGSAAEIAHTLRAARPDMAIVDLSADHRLRDPATYRAFYGKDHPHPDVLTSGEWVYGLTEANRAHIAAARYVANPGCFATGAVLAALPLARAGLIEGEVHHAAITGSSGSGVEPSWGTHHPERVENVRAYKVLTHQHVPEIVRCLRAHGRTSHGWQMVPQSGPFSRGIFTTLFVPLTREMATAELRAIYDEAYADEPFVRVRDQTPFVRHVTGTNFCDVSVYSAGTSAVVLTAIDNLGKGMASQAIQNLNLVLGLPETTGLAIPGSRP